MLAHGMMDNNVPPYNVYLVIDALNKANKDYDLVLFPHSSHGFGAYNPYMMRRRWDYFVKHLQGVTTPKEYNLRGANQLQKQIHPKDRYQLFERHLPDYSSS